MLFWSLATQESEETVIHFCPHPQNRGTDSDEGERLGIRDPGDVFTIILQCIIINLTYSGSRKEKLWPGLKSKVRLKGQIVNMRMGLDKEKKVAEKWSHSAKVSLRRG